MKTKIINWVTSLSLASFVVFLSMAVMSQHKQVNRPYMERDSIVPLIGLKIPDSTQIKVQVKHNQLYKIDSLRRIDSALAIKNEIGIKTVIKKKEKFEQYKQTRKTPSVNEIPVSSPSLATNLTPPDTVKLKKKTSRSLLDKIFHRKR